MSLILLTSSQPHIVERLQYRVSVDCLHKKDCKTYLNLMTDISCDEGELVKRWVNLAVVPPEVSLISWLDTTAIAGVHRIQWRKQIIQISKVFGWTVPFKVFPSLLCTFEIQINFILSLRTASIIRNGDEKVLDLNVLFPGPKMGHVFSGPFMHK